MQKESIPLRHIEVLTTLCAREGLKSAFLDFALPLGAGGEGSGPDQAQPERWVLKPMRKLRFEYIEIYLNTTNQSLRPPLPSPSFEFCSLFSGV